jgi:hypothetical protein
MLFSLEALEARKGDSLIVHFGESNRRPRFIVIDGGPSTVYRKTMKPRLEQIWKKWKQEDGKLDVNMLMVSHIDDDHIHGVIDWLSDLDSSDENLQYNIQTLWFNSFDEVLGNGSDELRSRLAALAEGASAGGAQTASFNADPRIGQHSAAVVASVGQGRTLRTHAQRLAIPLNRGFRGLVMSKETGGTIVKIGSGLSLHVLCPTRDKLAELQTIWEKDIRANPSDAEVAAFADKSVANLSSIVVAAEMTQNGTVRRMLLSGDARGDHILEGLAKSSLPKKDGHWHFDVFKLPHHGSDRNATEDMFRTITADHYVISANGEHDNPDETIIHWIARARGQQPYTIYLTNRTLANPANGKDISKIINTAIAATAAQATHRKIVFRDDAKLSICVDTGNDHVNY